MGEIYGGHLVAKCLRQAEGVSTLFTLAGGHIDRIFDGCLEYGIRIIDVRHEQAAAMMAHAWSIFGNHPGVCLITAGPGYTNALTGLVNAWFDHVPLILISGTAPIRDWDRGTLQEMNQADMVRSLVKWSALCHDIKRIPEYIAKAFRHAVAGRPGPVLLELPPDILNVKVDESRISYCPQGGRIYRTAADPADLQKAAGLIDAADRPFIIGGSGIGFSDCEAPLKAFIEKTGIPFLLLNTGRGAVADDHPLSLADGGFLGAQAAFSRADLVIVLGIRLNWLLQYGQTFPQAKVVRVDIEPTEIDRNRAADAGLVGDMGVILGQLNPLVEKRKHNDWLLVLKEAYRPLLVKEAAAREKASDPIHPCRLIEQVRRTYPEAIYVVDGGDTSYFGSVGLRAREKSSVIIAAGGLFGCIGTGVPFGIAAKLARPEKLVIVINGDGSFGINAMEFHTAVRHNIPFLCVINNDQAWGMIKHGQEKTYGDERVVATGLGVVHYEKIVEALGGYGEFVTDDEGIVPALERALASGKPACVNVLTDATVASPAMEVFIGSLQAKA
jgi:acetolactate synthase-1/2/3 large subunit